MIQAKSVLVSFKSLIEFIQNFELCTSECSFVLLFYVVMQAHNAWVIGPKVSIRATFEELLSLLEFLLKVPPLILWSARLLHKARVLLPYIDDVLSSPFVPFERIYFFLLAFKVPKTHSR